MKAKGLIAFVLVTALAISATACGETKIEKVATIFDDYCSNTVIATGNNNMIEEADTITYRCYFPLEEYGELVYRFYFSNTVDSTWADGSTAYAGMDGGEYTILDAHIYDGGTSTEDDVRELCAITFDGSTTKTVASGETYWSDEVTIDIEEGHYLVWEWTISGANIPCIRMSNLANCYYLKNDEFIYCNDTPLPQLIGAKREDVTLKICNFGDSITQGCATTDYAQNFWVSEIYENLDTSYSVWNLGLGYSRASDAALCGDWLERAKSADIVTVAFGTNDEYSGAYGADGSSSADEIATWLTTIVTELRDAGCEVILFNAPPFDFREDVESIRVELNEQLPTLADTLGVRFFDWCEILEDPTSSGTALYGGHPNDEGCKLVADAFCEQFADLLGLTD